MAMDTANKVETEAESTDTLTLARTSSSTDDGAPTKCSGANEQNGTNGGQFPSSKADKPKPHQKLHMTNPASSRPRTGRRESVTGAGSTGAKVRKNSVANISSGGPTASTVAGHRPRANTISHLDLSSLGLLHGTNEGFSRFDGLGISHGSQTAMDGMHAPMNFDFRGMSASSGLQGHGNPHGLPKLDVQSINSMDPGNSLRTAPPMAGFGGFDLDSLFGSDTTVNPAQLHVGGPLSSTTPSFPQYPDFNNQQHPAEQNDEFGWMRNWNLQMQANDDNEQVIDESSPSRMSSGDSPGDYNDSLQNSNVNINMQQNHFQWPQRDMLQPRQTPGESFQLDALGSGLPKVDPPLGMMNGHPHQEHMPHDIFFQQALLLQQQQQQQQQMRTQAQNEGMQGIPSNGYPPSASNFSSDSPSVASSSMAGSARQSSVTSASPSSINDATRQALLMSLSQPSVFGHNHRKYSQPSISSPLSPSNSRGSGQSPSLPSTADICRYLDSFIQFAHPHMPVTHVPTLSFDAEQYSSAMKSPAHVPGQANIQGGGGCLILGMAAMGALYEYDHPASKELFDASKKMMFLDLEERRKADMSAAVNGPHSGDGGNNTPLWLVQAMLLNVIYGHQCGDKTAADIASNHCAALVSLARAADLAKSPDDDGGDVNMVNGVRRYVNNEAELHQQWLEWKNQEERKRTLFSIFIISSLLTTAYNQTPTIMNSEILLDLPCDEELYAAGSAQEWQNLGGLAACEASSVPFAEALSTLLTANQRETAKQAPNPYNSSNNNNPLGTLQAGEAIASLKPSTFGCLVLINALHNYIWETRSRHNGRQWTAQETESMFTHIEPALNAWQAAWKARDHHKLERPNPFGLGPLAADSIPLLDLAFVRLFVNLGRAKEAFWQRDFDGMANELARGTEIVQHAEGVSSETPPDEAGDSQNATKGDDQKRASQAALPTQTSTKRERHLRKAAFYAADSLTIACSYNLTYADATAHELPIQSAICFFDCCQVLAEWACTVQERVGSFLGILGRDQIDYTHVPAIMLLEGEDVELLRKIERICESLETKRFQQENLLAMDLQHLNASAPMNMHNNVNLGNCTYGSKVLRISAMMLEKAVVWPVTHVMAKALETQAAHMDSRAEASIAQ
ncbi:hypothetical protein MBLNU230_g0104t1 [Neophaeotheca triangularis]